VDTFLFISAFLAMFLLLKKLDREQRSAARWMPMVYINRFLRITPAYMFALFFNWLTAPIFSKGPLAKQVRGLDLPR
jgi:peptidoglycan/LPS O-acetylase OafA/YrhL